MGKQYLGLVPSRSAPTYDLVVNLMLVGAPGVGKTSLVHRFVEDSFVSARPSTIGMGDCKASIVHIPGSARIKVRNKMHITSLTHPYLFPLC